MDAPQAAFVEAKLRMAQAKETALADHLRRTIPGITEEQVRLILKHTPIEIRPEDVPRKFPLKAVLAFLYAMGAIAAIRLAAPTSRSEGEALPATALITASGLAAITLATLAIIGGWIYRAPGLLN